VIPDEVIYDFDNELISFRFYSKLQ